MENATQEQAEQRAQDGRQPQQAQADPQQAASARAALVDSVAKATGLDRAIVATLSGADEDELTEQAQAIAAIAKPRGGAPSVPEAGVKQKPGKPSKKEILGIEDKKERMAAIAANIDLFK